MPTPEILTIGRVSVDLYAEQINEPMRNVTTFRKSVGGTATNVAVAAARLGRHAALVTKVGDDQFGDYVQHALEHTFNVDARYVSTDPDLQTPLAFAELDPPEDPSIIFYRSPRAPDLNIDAADVDADVVASVPIFWLPASRFSDPKSAETVTELLHLRKRKSHTVLDLDWRPMFWESPEAAREQIAPMLSQFTIAIGNKDECEIAVGTRDLNEAADRLLEAGLEMAVMKLGADGVMIATADGARVSVPPYLVEVVSGLGSGDAFGGAFCHGLLEGWTPEKIIKWGNAAGAIVAGRLMCADDMPTIEDIETLLAERGET
ncbi:MAG: 5-dehydro-2-deoxygluconokinase [Acidimicrobiales bacterium]|nr:5-dehydro-2-deoxygluconokinase [Acidimicrobiia bacterium]NNC80080.1 5-dehydro-2-deoxygluconokinase [Acidimicrobiales bacterium]RZV48212.1 MAG: 5-dehydro-2-deoxygluconokinase [Acidimicrobiales bacterium]